MTIIYNIKNRKLNNDLRWYLNLLHIEYYYLKDYQKQVRVVILKESIIMGAFKHAVMDKRKVQIDYYNNDIYAVLGEE